MSWRTASRSEVAANPLAYHRSRYMDERRAWPQHTRLELTEYGWMRKLRARPTLTKLVAAERSVDATLSREGR